ncbi:MAG: glycine cleavage system protein GcvH [Phycisphaerales bacterium]|nr:glycine cleavage system protein GcvH [Phycisphaerales bacterium]
MASPADYRFSDSHEWFKVDGDVVTVGISKYAADELTDITYVEMKPVGTRVQPGGSLGEVESVKTTSDVYSAVGGEVVEVNGAVAQDPSLVNSDSFGAGWLVKLRCADTAPIATLMDAASYDQRHPVA